MSEVRCNEAYPKSWDMWLFSVYIFFFGGLFKNSRAKVDVFIQISQAVYKANDIITTTSLTKFTSARFWKVIKMLQNRSDYRGFV